MLIVTNITGQCEPITTYNGYERHEEVSGSLKLSFSSFFDVHNPGHDIIAEESIIEKDGYEYRVKQLSANRFSKQVIAMSTYFDLIGFLKEGIFGGTKTFDEFATWVFNDTGWIFENVDVTEIRLLPNFGDANVVTLTKQLIATFECEYQILPNKVIRFAKKIGPDNDAQYRYGHNIKALSKKVDTTKLRTQIKGIGGNGLTVTYTSPNAALFPNAGAAETIKDDSFTVAESLTEHIKRELIDYPEVSMELDAIELQQKEIGERVWLIYEPLGIEFQTRVLAKVSRIPESNSSVVLGTAVPRRLSDILTSTKIEIDKNKKETRSKFEQTNEMITLEVERVDESIASLVVQSDSVVLNVAAIDGRLGTAEGQISVQAGQISSKVSYVDYNGNTVMSMLNQTATTFTLQASKINLVGAVTVLSDITGNLGTITAGSIDIDTDATIGTNLNIGKTWQNSSTKQIIFDGAFGGARMVYEPQYAKLTLVTTNSIDLSSTFINMIGTVDFSNASVTNLTTTAVLG